MKKTKKSAQLIRSDQRLLLFGLFAAGLLIILFLMFSENPVIPFVL